MGTEEKPQNLDQYFEEVEFNKIKEIPPEK
jgi:hypothetical protein